MTSALELVACESNFSALSLRRIARHAGVVPTAFYRHFQDMQDLGMTLIEETFSELGRMLREADLPSRQIEGLTHYSIQLFASHVRDRRLLFQFLIKERYAGSEIMRQAIRKHIDSLIKELMHDLSQFDNFRLIDDEDLSIIAELVVNTVIAASEQMLDESAQTNADAIVMRRAEKQLRLIFLGVAHWDSRLSGPTHPYPDPVRS